MITDVPFPLLHRAGMIRCLRRIFVVLESAARLRSTGVASRGRLRLLAALGAALMTAACGQENRFVAPPPPKVTVQLPVQQTVTPYLEATGKAAAERSLQLMARVEG